MKLGESYFFVDTSESSTYQVATAASGEMYFKRAVRIAGENPDADWIFFGTRDRAGRRYRDGRFGGRRSYHCP